ncbi:unnamed protein product [Malus baccata var. baccata]
MPGSKEWRKTTLVPIKFLMYHKQPGRPKTSRKKKADEIPKRAIKLRRYDIVTSCNICEVDDHNSATCRNNEHEVNKIKVKPNLEFQLKLNVNLQFNLNLKLKGRQIYL